MKLKSLLFGSAAVLAAGTGALAADLPYVEPVDYVRICDAFGAQFYYIPGTDTCLRVGGYVRVDSRYVNSDGTSLSRFGGTRGNGLQQTTINANDVNNWTTLARGHIILDARTQTDFGLIRSYMAYDMTVSGGNTTTGAPGTGTVGGAPNASATAAVLDVAYIQISNDWGTYTAGHTGSFFDFYGGNGYGSRLGLADPTGSATLFAWTFAGGNGFSFTLSAEDPASIGRRANGDDDYEGQEFPDGVANIRVDQGWGSAQVMAAVRHINDSTSDGVGFAVGGGLSLNLPGGWTGSAQGGYSDGAVKYVTGDVGAIGDFNGPAGSRTNQAWGVVAGLTGPLFMPTLSGWVDGTYQHGVEADNGDSYDWWAMRAGAKYAPVDGIFMGPEFAYQNFDGDDANEDWDIWGVMWRVQRDF
jgi:hypothetical protein